MDLLQQEVARCLFRESNDALFIFAPRNHRVVDVNPVALRLTGFDKEAACGKWLHELFTSPDPGGLPRLIEAYRRTGFYHSREGYFLGRAAGPPIPVNVSVSRIHIEPEPLGLVVARDITDRIAAQERLRESEERYRGLVETAQLIIWSASASGEILTLNPAFQALTGWTREAWIGRPFAELFIPSDVPAVLEAFRAVQRGEAIPQLELGIRSATGEAVVIEVLSTARQAVGDRLIISGIARDCTERKRAEEALKRAESMRIAKEAAEAADRAKSEFLGQISHEIRTPMSAILGFSEVLIEDDRIRALPPDLLENLRTIQQNGVHLLDLINDILDLTKVEMGKLRIEEHPCSPARIVEDVAASLRPKAAAQGLALVLEVDPAVPPTIRSDPIRLRQILTNLLSNAIKFTPEGRVTIRVGLDRAEGTGSDPTLRFSVIDTGIGLSDADLSRLFEPFYTSGAHPQREVGNGLGLAISRQLAGLLGGQIAVTSRPGEGSHFAFTVPVPTPGPSDPAAGGPVGPEARDAPTIDGRILLAEDNESIRRFMALRLQQLGAEVDVARNGQEAIDLALAALRDGRPFDWILMDVQMPVVDGYEATRRLRGEGYRRPIIAVTAYAIPAHREESLRFGCDDHVSKPVEWGGLIEVLHRLRPDEATDRAPGPSEKA